MVATVVGVEVGRWRIPGALVSFEEERWTGMASCLVVVDDMAAGNICLAAAMGLISEAGGMNVGQSRERRVRSFI